LPAAEQQLVCVGAGVPAPDWNAYLQNPATIPDACVGGATGSLPTQTPQVTVFDPAFGAPRAWRASLGAQHRSGTWLLGLDLSLARGVSQSGFTDRNLGDARFALGDEANRPVFVPAALIDPPLGDRTLGGIAQGFPLRTGAAARLQARLPFRPA
jgi:hypothetical protein